MPDNTADIPILERAPAPADAALTVQQPAQPVLAHGLALQRAGKLAEAVAAYDEALAFAPGTLAALVNKGVVLRLLGRPAEAMACYWQALALDSAGVEPWLNAGNALLDLQRDDEARVVLKVALQRAPTSAEPWLAIATALQHRNQMPTAEACLRRAVALAPDHPPARLRLAASLASDQPESALAEFAVAQKLAPAEPSAHSGQGQALISLGRLDEAEPCLRRALALDPTHLDARLGLARLLLLSGDLAAGWMEYEWRRRKPEGKYPKLSGPEWDGSDPAGKTILVYAEQGFGDTLQFIRYLPLLAQRGARVVVVCQKSLLRLVQSMEGVASAQAVWKPLPAYDCHIPLLSLPLHFATTAATIPAQVPYLSGPGLLTPLPAPIGTRLKIGLVWAGSATHGHDQDRSAGLETLLPLTGVSGTAFHSLQVGPRAGDLAKCAHPALLTDLSPALQDFAYTAGIIDQLDLVITVDTAVAHLAGALGKPVWVLIPFAPDWRWLREGDDTPWYPTMRLFRQSQAGDWDSVVERMVADLTRLVAERPALAAETTDIIVDSLFADGDGTPRFRMTAPRSFLTDPGIRFLVERERAGIGYEFATRSFLDAHLRSGDLFIDVGAHWGIMSLQAVTAGRDDVRALAIEPSPRNLPHLHHWIDSNRVTDRVEIVGAAASNQAGRGDLKPESTMGHSLIPATDGPIPVVTIDGLLAERPALATRRVIVKIDVEGNESEVVQGMAALLASGRVAAVIWERGVEYNAPSGQHRLTALRARFDGLGFTAWRFDSEDHAGSLVPFIEDGRRGNVIELAPGLTPLAGYGQPRPPRPAQPADAALEAALQSRQAFQASLQAHAAGKTKEVLACLATAATLDATTSEVWNNLGVTLRGLGHPAAAIACYRRALTVAPRDTGVLSNLANVLRESGRLEEARILHDRALALAPDRPGLIYNAGLVDRDQGRPAQALAAFERVLTLDPAHPDCRWDHALALLQQGDYAQGFPAYEARWGLTAAVKRNLPLPLWDGSPLNGKTVFLHDEQGFGDVLQFARFIPEVKARGAGKVVLECQPELMRLMAMAPGVDAVIPRHRGIPACDVAAPLLSLPGLFGTTLDNLPAAVPYLRAPEPAQILPEDGRLKLGLVWAGKLKPRDRSCPLALLLPLLGHPRFAPFSLQTGPRAADLAAMGADSVISDLAPRLTDFAETAALLTQLDLLVTIDTSIAHLAGALGVPTFLLLRYTSDWRWFDHGTTSPWYPSLRLFRQQEPNRWDGALAELGSALAAFADHGDA